MQKMFIPDSQLKGLYQRERVTGNKWVVKAKQRGINKPVTVTLGRVDVISVREARRLARDKLALLAEGVNPNTQSKLSRDTDAQLGVTLSDAIDAYLALRELKPSTIKSYRQVLGRSFKDWFSLQLRQISRQDIVNRYVDIQSGIAKRQLQPEKANPRGLADAQKAMRYLSAIMNSYSNDTVNGKRLLPDGNPVLVLKDKRARVRLKARDRFLNEEERRLIFDELTTASHYDYKGKLSADEADFVYFLIVTGLRLEEVKTLRWRMLQPLRIR